MKPRKRRQFVFNTWAATLRIWKHGNLFIFNEAHLGKHPYDTDWRSRAATTYEACVAKMQRYCRRYYGKKAI